MRFRHFSPKEKFLPMVILLAVAIIFLSNHFGILNKEKSLFGAFSPVISTEAEAHILERHLFASGQPCKTEFPENWSAQKVLSTVSYISSEPSNSWRQEDNGYFVSEQMIEGVKVRVILNEDKSHVVTAYPINLNRNPCPANDN